MGKEKQEQHQASYHPLPYQARFWLYSESCYTEEELNLRQLILKNRANSGIHPDYLNNPGSWFAQDDQALIDVYKDAWFYSKAFKTHQTLSRDDFHVQPVNGLQWPDFYGLMQTVGDYLLLRNQNLPPEHLNQPMNFFFLDLNHILKGLSQNPNKEQVKEQLELLNHYLRSIEKNISPLVGSDRLFLANFRYTIDEKIYPQLNHLIESQLLRDRLGGLSRTINTLSTNRNRILHFALNINNVNPHSFEFSQLPMEDTTAFPTQAAKNCGQTTSTELVADPTPILQLTVEQLENCANFKLISMDKAILNHYARAISDLNELERFQKVISHTMDLLGQAGEVYTIYQFKEQLVTLLRQIDDFIDSSSQHIEAIIHANTQEYHKAIEIEQNMSLWKKWFTSEKEKLLAYIKNQDTLAQFPSSTPDLIKTNKQLKEQVNQVVTHLNQPKMKETNFEAIAGQAQELDRLMGSMHQWIKIQHEIKGLPAPNPPQLLQPPSPPVNQPPPSSCITSPPPSSLSFFAPQQSPAAQPCQNQTSECSPQFTPPAPSDKSMLYLGLIALLPIGIIFLYLYMNWNKKKEAPVLGSKEEFLSLKNEFKQILKEIQKYEKAAQVSLDYEYDLDEFNKLLEEAKSGTYYTQNLSELVADLRYFYENECPQSTANSSLS